MQGTQYAPRESILCMEHFVALQSTFNKCICCVVFISYMILYKHSYDLNTCMQYRFQEVRISLEIRKSLANMYT